VAELAQLHAGVGNASALTGPCALLGWPDAAVEHRVINQLGNLLGMGVV
jgi:hypothetical protein